MIADQEIPAYPLCWPDRIPRTPGNRRRASAFKTGLPAALKNVQASVRLFATDSGKRIERFVISSNVTLGAERPTDPGVAVWFTWDGLRVCIPVDRYDKVQDNLQAIHHILEARRVELRHGGIEIVRASFTGFQALPAPSNRRPWHEVLEVQPDAGPGKIRDQYRLLSKSRHPDTGGSDEQFAELSDAYELAKKERGEA